MAITVSCFVSQGCSLFESKEIKDWLKTQCLEYQFDLELRRVFDVVMPSQYKFLAEASHLQAACHFFDKFFGTPEKLIEFTKTGQLSKIELARLLNPDMRQTFLTVCGIIEKEATDKCGSSGNSCLEDGCAFEGTDETCLNAILLSEGKCLRACTDVWVKLFENPNNRIPIWRS